MKTLFVLISIILTMNSCEKIADTTWVYYDETECSDPWGVTSDDISEKEKKQVIEDYLKENNLKVYKTEISNEREPEGCKSCFCKTGVIIKCKVKVKDEAEFINLGFQNNQ